MVYTGLEGVTKVFRGFSGLLGATWVTRGYKGLSGVKRGYWTVKRVFGA